MSPAVGPGEGPQFLLPEHGISRRKTMHRRGYSSDISGDQTDSSDEGGASDSSHALSRRISPPGYMYQYSREFNQTGTQRNANGSHEGWSQHHRQPSEPFKLVVRKPSGLGTIAESHDSSGESVSGSGPSPEPELEDLNTHDMRFAIVPSNGNATFFGMPSEHHVRPSSPQGRLSNCDARNASGDTLSFATIRVGPPQHQHVAYSHVHHLTRDEKSAPGMLGAAPETDIDPAVLLHRLARLSPEVAKKFEVKPNMEKLFNFRLIYGNREVTKRQHQSFIALSYRRKLHVEKHAHHYTLPLEPEMFQAVWDERQGESEGIWVDQICIDQDSGPERTISMSAMDMVYRSARKVVVALDDIEPPLEAHEGELLQNHMDEYHDMRHVPERQRFRRKAPPYLDTHEGLFKVIRKILRSPWFQRAWCRHEMRLAKHHVFLVPCKRPGTCAGRDILRFNGKCLAHLLDLAVEVPFEPDVEAVKPALHAFFRDRARMAPGDRHMLQHHGNFSTVVAEVFAMETGGDPRIPPSQRLSDARKDKIAIILNTMECGLALHEQVRDPSVIIEDNQCYHDLSLLALAAQDPGALCSVGKPLPVPPSDDIKSWLHVPTVADSGLNNFKTLERLPPHARISTNTKAAEHYIQLDLKFFRRGPASRAAIDPDVLKLAQQFTKVCEDHRWGRNRERYLLHDRKAKLFFGSMHDLYVETLACIFQCGPNWVHDVCIRYSMSRWKVDLLPAWNLLVALQNTNGRWPVSAWDARAAGFLMDFVNFLIVRGLPLRQLLKPEPWRPFWIENPAGGKVLTFAPVSDDHAVYPTVPTVLINPDYVHLARLWLLKPRAVDAADKGDAIYRTDEWTLLGKSVLFSDEVSIANMSAHRGDLKDQQRVYGRHREDVASGGIRRRS